MITRRLAATPEPQRTELTAAISTALGRNTFSAVLRANQNAPHRLSDHSFGFAIDIDSPRNPNIGTAGGLGPVQDVTGDDPTAGTTPQDRTGAQVETTATDLREISDEYKAAMTSDATLAPVLLRLANEGRARVAPPLPGADVGSRPRRGRGARRQAAASRRAPGGALAGGRRAAPAPPRRSGGGGPTAGRPRHRSEIAAAERRIAPHRRRLPGVVHRRGPDHGGVARETARAHPARWPRTAS